MSMPWLKNRICLDCKKTYKPTGTNQRFCKICGVVNEKQKEKLYSKSEYVVRKRHEYDRSEKGKAKYKRYRAKEKYKIYGRIRYYSMDKNKRKAQYYLSNAVRDKRLIRPDKCEECGGNEVRIEGHHYKGYEPKNWLVIKWLDVPCHKKAHLRKRVSEA